MTGAVEWLGLERVSDDEWRLPVTVGVISGARALFGGCATVAAIVAAQTLAEQPVVFAASHFGSLAKLDTIATIRARVIAQSRTLSHIEVEGSVDGKQSFLTRLTTGARPPVETEGQWIAPIPPATIEDSAPFEHPVHEGTWASRFEFRLAGVTSDGRPSASWWVRPKDEDLDPIVAATVLVDYVTYGVGRPLGVPIGGISIDNVVRVHRVVPADWYLLQVMPDAIEGGLGFGSAAVFADGSLVVSGTQSIAVMPWDWRLPSER